MDLTSKLKEMGLELPQPAAAVASYVPVCQTGNLLFISGQLPFKDGAVLHPGHLGRNVSIEDGQKAAQQCALNIIAQINGQKIKRVVKCVGFIASTPDFTDHSVVMNGASDLFEAVFGDKGKHARAAVGVAALPKGASVEVEAIVEVE
jgi:enamine deaminase RidA (YjgF/YER057c/UK114 family)